MKTISFLEKNLIKFYILIIIFFQFTFIDLTFSQSNPTAHDLSSSDFSFLGFAAGTTTTYPTSMQGWKFSAEPTSAITTNASADFNLSASTAAASTGSIRNEITSGISILNSSTNNLGAICISVNSTNRQNIKVSWTAAEVLQNGSRGNSISLQFRVGTSGSWTDVSATTYSTNTAQTNTAAQTFTDILIPSSVDNQSVVQFRWLYFMSSGTLGSRDRISLDDITISSAPIICNLVSSFTPPTSQCLLNNNFSFEPTSTGITAGLTQYIWNFGDGTASTTPTISTIPQNHSYANSGTYTVSLTTLDNANCSNTFSATVEVKEIPFIFPINNVNICANDTTESTTFSSNIQNTNFDWSNSDTTIGLASSGNSNITPFIVLNNDTFSKNAIISIIGTSPNGCISAPYNFTITVKPLPYLQNVITNLSLCQLDTAYFQPFQVVPSTSNINWTNNNPLIGLAASGQGNIPPFLIQSTPGGNIGSLITVTPTYAGCNGDFRVISLIAHPIPIINPVTDQILCNGDQTNAVNFTVIPNDATINWTNTEPGIGLSANGNGDISSFTTTNSGNSALVGYINAHAISVNNCMGPDEYFSITVNPNPNTIILLSTDESCNQSNGSITVSGANGGTSPYIYSFNGQSGTTSPNFSNLPAGNYTLTVQDANNCFKDSIVVLSNLNAVTPATPSICLVTVDDFSNHNIIYWDKTNYAVGDTFIVYREISLNNYAPVGRIPYDSMSMFADTNRVIYNLGNGDPNLKSWKYKLSVKNNCDLESSLSPYHQTMFFNQNNDFFSWSQYEIEGLPIPIPQLNGFVCVRDNNSTNNWAPVLSVNPNDTSYIDPDFALFSNTGSWRTNTNWTIQCTPTLRLDGNNEIQTVVVKSKSNIRNNRTVGVNNKFNTSNSFIVYPNPSNGKFKVILKDENQQISAEVISSKGDKILNTLINKSNSSLDLSLFEKGIYYLKLKTSNGIEVVKLVNF